MCLCLDEQRRFCQTSSATWKPDGRAGKPLLSFTFFFLCCVASSAAVRLSQQQPSPSPKSIPPLTLLHMMFKDCVCVMFNWVREGFYIVMCPGKLPWSLRGSPVTSPGECRMILYLYLRRLEADVLLVSEFIMKKKMPNQTHPHDQLDKSWSDVCFDIKERRNKSDLTSAKTKKHISVLVWDKDLKAVSQCPTWVCLALTVMWFLGNCSSGRTERKLGDFHKSQKEVDIFALGCHLERAMKQKTAEEKKNSNS